MSQLQYVSVKSQKPKVVHQSTVVTDTSQSDDSILKSLLFFTMKQIFESVDTDMTYPVQVVDDTIKLKEYLMKENQPYAFSYKGKDYVINRKKGKTQLFELK